MFRLEPDSDGTRYDTAEEAEDMAAFYVRGGCARPAVVPAPERRHRDLAPAIVRDLLGEDDPELAERLEDCLDWSLCSPYSDPADWTVTLEEGGGPPRLLVDFLDGLAPERV